MLFYTLFIFTILLATTVGPAAAQNPKDLQVKLPDLTQPDLSGEFGSQISYLMHRQLGADCRERLVFGGSSYLPDIFTNAEPGKRMREHQIRPYTSLVCTSAIALTFGEYNQAASGIERRELAKIVASLARELSAHHVANTDKSSWWWGDEWQSAHWSWALGVGAWLVWDRLPADTRRNVLNMIVFEANRFLDEPAPFNEFNDTKAEENAWNQKILALAHCMLPNHPHNEAWGTKAIEYMVTSYAAPQDVESKEIIDGKPLCDWLRGPNVHSDYTLENHGFFHPDYIAASAQNVQSLIIYRLAGKEAPQSALFNIRQLRELLNFLTLPNGWTFYPQWTDWSNYRHDILLMTGMTNPLMPDPVAARCLRWGLGFINYADSLDKGKTSKNLFRGINFNCSPVHSLATLYLMHYLFGPGTKPASDEQACRQLTGTRLYEMGKCVVSRSENSIASFSWFDSGRRLMAVVTPLSTDGFCLPRFRSLIGYVDDKTDEINILKREVKVFEKGGFSAGIHCERGQDRKLKEKILMAVLPDGRTVYAEWFDPSPDLELKELRTGLVYFEKDAFWHRGVEPAVFHPNGRWTRGNEPVILKETRWLNFADRMWIVVYGSNGVLIDEDRIALNFVPDRNHKIPECVVSIFLPGLSAKDTALKASQIKAEAPSSGVAIVDLGDVKVRLDADSLSVHQPGDRG